MIDEFGTADVKSGECVIKFGGATDNDIDVCTYV